jgi:transposase
VSSSAAEPKIKYVSLDRSQLQWAAFDLDSLIDQQHPARMIWQLTEKFDLKRFEEHVKTRQGEAGRSCWSAQLLVSVWVYAYSLGVASARAIERMMSHEPGFRWLTADQVINHHTVSDFRVGQEQAVKELFAQMLTVLETAGLVDLTTLLHDGTKVKSVAGRASLHRRKTVEKRLREARRVVRKLETAAQDEAVDERRRAAQERAAREGLQRAEAALAKLRKLDAAAKPEQRDEQRVSVSEPDARKMKQPEGGWALSYNVQVTTEAQSRMIVAVGISTEANDTRELMPALERVQENCGKLPERVIADNGYATRSNVERTTEEGVELIAPWKEDASREAGACARNRIDPAYAPSVFHPQRGGRRLTCPAGKTLVIVQQKMHHELLHNVFEASASDCGRCRHRQQCCGKSGAPRQISRVAESAAMKQYRRRMKQPEVKQLYAKRSEIAEFPHMWAKAVKRWRRFSVRGVVKAGMEATWVALAYNVSQWIRLRPSQAIPA